VSSVDNDVSGVPDYIEAVATYCDTSLQSHRDRGYLDPPSDGTLGGDATYDVYFEHMDYYGYAVPEAQGPEPWYDWMSYIVLRNNYIGFPPNNDPEGDQAGAAKATAAHEFHHAVQFAYDGGDFSWFMELDATYFEDIAFNHVDDNYNYLPSFFGEPHVSMMGTDLSLAYGRFPWGLYLAQTYDTSLMTAVWEGARYQTVFDALSDTLVARYGVTQDEAFAEFAIWNYLTSARDDGLHHEEALQYPTISLGGSHAVYPVSERGLASAPQGYGASYILFSPPVTSGTYRLIVDINGGDAADWEVYAVMTSGLNQHVIEQVALAPSTFEGSLIVQDFDTLTSVAVIAVNVNEFGPAVEFRYSASLQQSQAFEASMTTQPLSVYSGAERTFTYWVKNTSQLSDLIDVRYSDSEGWVVLDSSAAFIQPGDSFDVSIPVVPPVGTPLEAQTTLYIHTESRYEAEVFVDHQYPISTVLWAGEATFDGFLDISDILRIARYALQGGEPPSPVIEAGDYDCDGFTDITDILGVARFALLGGDPSPCWPFLP
jgi:hypothetical protein